MQKKSNRLGRGIDALLGDLDLVERDAQDSNLVKIISISLIVANENQPRQYFDDQSLQELASSITQQGILQPILVEKVENFYRVVAGERRFRAAKIAKLENIPVIIRQFNDEDRIIVSLLENIQRENISPIEEANTYKRLMGIANLNQQELSDRLGKSRSAIANTLRLLNLPNEVQQTLQQGLLSAGHARVLLTLEDPGQQKSFLEEILDKKISVRALENKVRTTHKKIQPQCSSVSEQETKILKILTTLFEAPTEIEKDKYNKKGCIKIYFSEKSNLNKIAEYLEKLISENK